MLAQTNEVVVRMPTTRRDLQEGDDVLSQQPLAASAHFFSMKAPDPSEQEITPVPPRVAPDPCQDANAVPRAHVSKMLC